MCVCVCVCVCVCELCNVCGRHRPTDFLGAQCDAKLWVKHFWRASGRARAMYCYSLLVALCWVHSTRLVLYAAMFDVGVVLHVFPC